MKKPPQNTLQPKPLPSEVHDEKGVGAAATCSGCLECEARSSAQWVKSYAAENLGLNRAKGHCRTCRHRFRGEDSYFPDEGDYCSALTVSEIQFCPAWREYCQNT